MGEKVWQIIKHDSLDEVGHWEFPGSYSRESISVILQRLVCADLVSEEIINCCREVGDPYRSTFLDPIGNGQTMQYGENPWYTARLVDR
ncbi:hypothetical protein [Pleomorphomonas sp. JP5]|uniref:hypothetical protein n=1 Tax=Pleomorphomonas sp. JP5 TaxID=2942998 RepID=UPI00204419C3|nr:hypothetical protein [Pleomorphomonas sp. JP5]MCM5558473.1 hypothetical protein [Pleomorphomonas sp. JP5]